MQSGAHHLHLESAQFNGTFLDAADLRGPLRASESDNPLHAAIDEAIARKPKGHDFVIDRRHQRPALARHMSTTGG